jgi:hypothetical protein
MRRRFLEFGQVEVASGKSNNGEDFVPCNF